MRSGENGDLPASRFTVLQATGSWAGPGNEATSLPCFQSPEEVGHAYGRACTERRVTYG